MRFPSRIASLLLFFSIVYFGCKKEGDDIPPQVQLVAPSGANPSYDYADLAFVQMIATDESAIASWSVRLSDESGRVRFNSGVIPLPGDETRVEENFSFTLEDIHWPSGDYVLGVFVQDEHGNEGAAFKEVRYNEAPLSLEQLFIVTTSGAGTELHGFDTNGTVELLKSLPQDFSVGFAGSFHSEVLIGGNSSAVMEFLDDTDLESTGAFTSSNPLSGDFVREILFDPDGEYYFASFFDGFVRCFGNAGIQHLIIDIGENFRPESMTIEGDHLFVEVRQIGTNNFFIRDYDKHSGTLLNSNVLPGDVERILFHQNELYVFGNTGAEPFLILYDPVDLSFYDPSWLISDLPLRHVEPIQGNFFAVAHDDGVYIHNFAANIFMWGSNNGVSAKDIGFDSDSERLYVLGEDATLYQVATSSGMILNSWSVPADSEAILVQMNK